MEINPDNQNGACDQDPWDDFPPGGCHNSSPSPLTILVDRLKEAGSMGLDSSPGDALCLEAAAAITALNMKLFVAESFREDALKYRDLCQ